MTIGTVAIETMIRQLTRSWSWIVLRGVVAILFGILSFVWPGLTLAALVIVFAAYALSDGLLALVAAFKIRDGGRPMWTLILVGLLGIAAGVITFMQPRMTTLALLAFIAAWALATGIFQVATAIRLRKWIENEWILALSGLLSIAFGAIMLARPGAGALAVIWIIGGYATLFGILLVMLGFRLKGLANRVSRTA